MMIRTVALSVIGGLTMALAAITPAIASTTITSPTPPIVATFGDPWMLELTLSADFDGYMPPVGESSGTVDVFIEQLPGIFIDDLAVQSNGRAFITQPPTQPLLAPGVYDVRAVFTPAASTGLEAGQVRLPGAITITPLELAASIAVRTDASATPTTITIALASTGEGELSTLPPGVWNLSVREASGTELLASRQVLQTTSPEPLVVELADDFRPDVDHILVAEFVPVDEFASGVVVTGAGEIAFRTAPQDLGQFLVTPIDVPLWALIVALSGLAAGIAGLVIALVVRARRTPRAPMAPSKDAALDDAETIELADINDLFDAQDDAESSDLAAREESTPSDDSAASSSSDTAPTSEPSGDDTEASRDDTESSGDDTESLGDDNAPLGDDVAPADETPTEKL